MALYTGKGDDGSTKLFDSAKGKRITKSDPIFEALGTCDELNTVIGWAKTRAKEEHFILFGDMFFKSLHATQDILFTVQAELAGAKKSVSREVVEEMETTIHFIEKALPPITTFLVPGGTELSARLDVARALARSAERRIVALHESGERKVSEETRRYMNRLSSYLYACVRYVNYVHGVDELPPEYVS